MYEGYGFVGPCVSDPALGGMGDHYSLNAEIDFGRGDGTYALETPQYLVYAPQKNGRRRLAALDYTVPYEKWHSAEPPEFFGIPFTRNDGFGVWMFHIWLWWHNPDGMTVDLSRWREPPSSCGRTRRARSCRRDGGGQACRTPRGRGS